jgi:lysozyme
MFEYPQAVDIIKRYQGFNESACPDPDSGGAPYSIGYGTQYYPGGEPVKKGQLCTKTKATEYLLREVEEIANDLERLNLGLDASMKEALISFVHSVGWEPFLYSEIIDYCESEDWFNVPYEMSRWVFDNSHVVVGNLIERRREEISLFTKELDASPWSSGEVLLRAFRNYNASPDQIRAIRHLEEQVNPYVLAEFFNNFQIEDPDPFGYVDYGVGLNCSTWS